ncbi:MAG: molybdenum cofactor guanylyltransferase [Anaerolineales bacterium]|nr:molybdenum cofactor guanylyltransferase [Anaerolineales bacterium]
MLSVVIQAGGNSKRMGQDKALLPFLGEPLIHRVMKRLEPVADEILVTTNQPEMYRFLDVPLFSDIRPNCGALGGLFTALSSAMYLLVGVIACDMPFASATIIEHACNLLGSPEFDVVLPSTIQGLEPLHAVYRKKTCLPEIELALEAGERKVISWIDRVQVRLLSTEEITELDPSGTAFWNLNTPDDFTRAESFARIS